MAVSYLLDTNVVSELMHVAPEPSVMQWFELQPNANIFISAITQAELLIGIAMLPAGLRRDQLSQACADMLTQDFAGRCLPFDSAAAARQVPLVAQRKAMGCPISTEDSQIAAIALAHQLTLVTRNTRDFEAIEALALVNPWHSAGWGA